MFGGKNSFWNKPFGTGSNSVSGFLNNPQTVFDYAGKVINQVASPISQIPVIGNTLSSTLNAAGNLVDQFGNVISQAGDIAGKAAQDVGAEAGRAGKKVEKIAQSANKELHKGIGPTTEFIGNYGKGLEKTVSAAGRGDLKGIAKAQLQGIDNLKKYIIDSTKQTVRTYGNYGMEAGKFLDSKELQESSRNINREYEKGADTYGPAILDMVADYFSAGMYSLGKKGTQQVADEGAEGLLDEDFLKDVAIHAAASYAKSKGGDWAKYATPENLKAGKRVLEGDLEGAAYEKAGVDPEAAKALRKVLTEGVDIKDAMKEVLANKIATETGFSKEFARSLISGNISSIAKAGVGEAAGKFLPDDYAKLAKNIVTKKPNQIASEYASSYLGIDPAVLGMANKVIKDPKGEALRALGSYSNIIPDRIQSIRSGIGSMSGDLQASALQAAGNSMGMHPTDLEMGRQFVGNSARGAPFQALSKSLGIDPTYLQMGQDLYRGRSDFKAPTLDSFEDMPMAEIENAINEQTEQIQQKTNDIESKKSGKKVADLFDKTPGLARQFFWNT
jgi:hypothetical protein